MSCRPETVLSSLPRAWTDLEHKDSREVIKAAPESYFPTVAKKMAGCIQGTYQKMTSPELINVNTLMEDAWQFSCVCLY